MPVQRSGLSAPWRNFTNSDDEQRLMVLDARIERQEQILADTRRDQSKIMARAIRRKRRAEGKE